MVFKLVTFPKKTSSGMQDLTWNKADDFFGWKEDKQNFVFIQLFFSTKSFSPLLCCSSSSSSILSFSDLIQFLDRLFNFIQLKECKQKQIANTLTKKQPATYIFQAHQYFYHLCRNEEIIEVVKLCSQIIRIILQLNAKINKLMTVSRAFCY